MPAPELRSVDRRYGVIDAGVAVDVGNVGVVDDVDAIVNIGGVPVAAVVTASVPGIVGLIGRERHPAHTAIAKPDFGYICEG